LQCIILHVSLPYDNSVYSVMKLCCNPRISVSQSLHNYHVNSCCRKCLCHWKL